MKPEWVITVCFGSFILMMTGLFVYEFREYLRVRRAQKQGGTIRVVIRYKKPVRKIQRTKDG